MQPINLQLLATTCRLQLMLVISTIIFWIQSHACKLMFSSSFHLDNFNMFFIQEDLFMYWISCKRIQMNCNPLGIQSLLCVFVRCMGLQWCSKCNLPINIWKYITTYMCIIWVVYIDCIQVICLGYILYKNYC